MTRNVVLITVDSLRADHCGFLGYEGDTTPSLDEKAADGVVYENAVAPGSGTAFTMPAVFSGIESLSETESVESMQAWIRSRLDQCQTLPEWFTRQGYTTVGFTPNPYTSRYFGFDRGFDHFEDFLRPDSPLDLRTRIASRWANDEFLAGVRLASNMLGAGDVSVTWEDYYGDLRARIEELPEPFFLWVFLLEPHWPYRPPRRHRDVSLLETYRQNWRRAPASSGTPSETDAATLAGLYDGTIRHVDEFVDRISTDLSGYDPAFLLHADHGEAFGEHGSFGHGPHVYEENVHVPLVAWNVDATRRIRRPTSVRRVPELVREVATAPNPDWDRCTSPWVVSRGISTSGELAVEAEAVRTASAKVIRTAESDTVYDLEEDPGETSGTDADGRLDCVDAVLDARASRRAEKRAIGRAASGVAGGGGSGVA